MTYYGEIHDEASIIPLNPPINNWTAIIPAAGKGSRLSYDYPKILYPILGKPILIWLLDLLYSLCCKIVIVASPEGKSFIESGIPDIYRERISIVVQNSPTGMADAIYQAKCEVNTKFTVVMWGDQVAISNTTLKRGVALHEASSDRILTLPTIIRTHPYIDIVRDTRNRISSVKQKRENETCRLVGENDCGLFFFRSIYLFDVLKRSFGNNLGGITKESNLLQLLPSFEIHEGAVATYRITDALETMGVNTKMDAEIIEKIMLKRQSVHHKG